jgi:hypothetical protein
MESQEKMILTYLKKIVYKEETIVVEDFKKSIKKEKAEYWRNKIKNKGIMNFINKKRNTL